MVTNIHSICTIKMTSDGLMGRVRHTRQTELDTCENASGIQQCLSSPIKRRDWTESRVKSCTVGVQQNIGILSQSKYSRTWTHQINKIKVN